MNPTSFKQWLEGTFTFGTHGPKPGKPGKQHYDVPTSYLQWALQNVNNPRLISPEFRKEIEEEIQRRAAKGDTQGSRRSPTAAPASTSATQAVKAQAAQKTQAAGQNPYLPQQNKWWILATVIANVIDQSNPDDQEHFGSQKYNLKVGEKVGVAKRTDGDWDYFAVEEPNRKGEIPADDISKIVRSEKDANGQIKKFQRLEEVMPEKSVAEEQPQGYAKYRLPEKYIGPYQKEIQTTFLESKQHIVMNALAGSGKAQPLDSKLLTSKGWMFMKDVTVGDEVYGSDGMPHKVVGVFPQGLKKVFNVKFSDGSEVQCCGEHLWLTETKKNRDKCRFERKKVFSYAEVVTTQDIIETINYKGYPNHYIPLIKPLNFKRRSVVLDAYLMGVLLGDGCFSTGSVTYSTNDADIVRLVDLVLPFGLKSKRKNKFDYHISSGIKGRRNEIVKEIKELGLWKAKSKQKFIPDLYKFNDIETRIAVLQGLIDTDGYVCESTIEYYSASKQLAEDVRFLVESLGGTATLTLKTTSYSYKGLKEKGLDCYRLNIKLPPNIAPCRLTRKLEKYVPRTKYQPKRTIVSVLEVGMKECCCISIDSKDSLYVTNNCVLTHNTTMLKHLASYKKPHEKWLYLVFNKKNQVEGKSKFPPDVEVLTSHAFLGQVLNRSAEFGKIEKTVLYTGKSQKISETLEADWFKQEADELNIPYNFIYPIKTRVKKLAGLAKSFALDPRKDIAGELEELIKKYNIDTRFDTGPDFKEAIKKLTFETLWLSLPDQAATQQLSGQRDHDDTLWYSSLFGLSWPKYDVVLADEVQDFNKCQMFMLKNLQQAGARIVAVGDPNQAIYMFRGADSQAFNNLEQMLGGFEGGSKIHPLPVNYRCGKKIIDFVNEKTKVNNLQAGVSYEGEVSEHLLYDDLTDGLAQEWHGGQNNLQHETAILCRTNKPLAMAAMRLLKNNIRFIIVGKDLSKELVDHIRKITGFGRRQKIMPINDFHTEMMEYLNVKQEQWHNKISKADELKELQETSEALDEVLKYLSANNSKDPQTGKLVRTSEDFVEYIKRLFAGLNVDENMEDAMKYAQMTQNPKAFVTLATSHRSKGLEWDRVYILRNDLFPHPSAKTEEEIQQEYNGQYVAYTRAKHQLHVINDTEPGGKKKE